MVVRRAEARTSLKKGRWFVAFSQGAKTK